MAGAPLGSKNKIKNKPWADAIQRAMARFGKGKDNALNLIADQVVKAALNGDQWAITEIGNRTDGKAVQATEVSGPDGGDIPIKINVVGA